MRQAEKCLSDVHVGPGVRLAYSGEGGNWKLWKKRRTLTNLKMQVRDAALKIKDELPKSDVNREYYLQVRT